MERSRRSERVKRNSVLAAKTAVDVPTKKRKRRSDAKVIQRNESIVKTKTKMYARWERKWIKVGKISTIKWVPIEDSVLSAKDAAKTVPTSTLGRQEKQIRNALNRVYKQNAPMTRSLQKTIDRGLRGKNDTGEKNKVVN